MEGGGEGSVLEAEYIRLGRIIGAENIGVWPKIVAVVKRRVREEIDMATEAAERMDLDEKEAEDVRLRKAKDAARRKEVDVELRITLGGEGEDRRPDLELDEWHREEVMNGTLGLKTLVEYVQDWEGVGSLPVCSVFQLLMSPLRT